MNVSIGGIAKTVEITSFDKLGDVKVCMLTTTADGSVGFQQLNQEVIDTIYASFPVDTASGDIASFEDGADNVPVRELKLNLEPYQNLNGYDSPWVGGAGANKYNEATKVENYMLLTNSGEPYSNNNWDRSDFIPTTASSVRISWSSSSNYYQVQLCAYDSSKTFISGSGTSYSASEVYSHTFTLPTGVAYIRFAWSKVIGGSAVTRTQIRVNEGTTDLGYAPYENICPIYPNNGKNLLPTFSNEGTTRGITFSLGDNGTVIANGTATSAGDASKDIIIESGTIPTGKYKFSGCAIGGSGTTWNVYMWDLTTSSRAKKWDNSTNVVDCNSIEQWQEVYIDSSHRYQYVMRVKSLVTANNIVFYPMVYPSEITDSTYVPYNAIGITRTGKNLLNVNNPNRAFSGGTMVFEGSTLKLSGTASSTNAQAWPVDGFPLRAGTYTFSHDYRGTAVLVIGNWANSYTVATGTTKTFTLSKDTSVTWGVTVTSGTTYNDLVHAQIEIGSSASQYEPYTAERYYPISDNPVYGGTLDVTTGVLTVTSAEVDLGSLTWNYDTSVSKPRFYAQLNGTKNGTRTVYCICSAYKTLTHGEAFSTITDGTVYINPMTSYLAVCVHDSRYTDATTFKNAVNGVQFVYELATPLVYQLTPVQVKTLLGYNNIWTDSGTVEVQYRANIGLYIQKIIGVTEDDMVANQNISANKYFFVGEELYYSTSAISAGQTIVVGTNCIKTNLADALNALNS